MTGATSKLQVSKPQSIADHRYRGEAHGCSSDHRRHEKPGNRIEQPGSNRHTCGVVKEREEQVLADIADCADGELPSPHDAVEVTLHERDACTFHRHVGACSHG